MMVLTLLGKVLGLVRDMLLGQNFATGMAANAFLTASRIPRNFFDAIFASAISASFIPVFNEYLEKKGKDEAFRLSDAFLNLVLLATALLSAVGMLFAEPLTAFLADGFDAPTAALCTELLRILFPTVLFTGAAFSLVGILQSLGEFNVPALLSTASNGVILLYYLFFCKRFGVIGLAVAFLLGWAMQVAIQLPSLRRFGYRYHFSLWHEGMRKVGALALPVLVSTWLQPLNLTVATKYASHLASGAATSALEYANTLYTIVAGVFVLSIANVIFPELSRISARKEDGAFGESLSETIGTMLFFLTPMAVGMAVLAKPIIRLLYEWGAWDAASTELTAGALTYLSLGMVGYGLQIILSRAYYADQKGKMPMLAGLASVLVNLGLCAFLAPKTGIRGLALAGAISLLVPALLMLFDLARQYRTLLSASAWLDFGKTLLCAAAMATAAYVSCRFSASLCSDGLFGRVIVVGVPVVVGAAVYFACAALLRVHGIGQMRELLHKKGQKI